MPTAAATVEEALAELVAGRMVVVVDDPERENEGDLVLAAQFTTPEAVNFMARRAGGWISLALTPERCDALGLETITRERGPRDAPFTQTIEAREGVTTGVSAADQALSIQVAIDRGRGPDDLVSPGHVQPLRAHPGGVLARRGHTEAAVDLMRLAGLTSAGVVCEIMNEDGSMARPDDLERFCAQYGLKLLTIADLAAYRRLREPTIERVVDVELPTTFGVFTAVGYRSLGADESTHMAFVKGGPPRSAGTLVRVQARCLAGDVFHSLQCDCGPLLDSALSQIDAAGAGALLYVASEDGSLRLHGPGDDGAAVPAAERVVADGQVYGVCAQMLLDLGIRSVRLLSPAPGAEAEIGRYGIEVAGDTALTARPG